MIQLLDGGCRVIPSVSRAIQRPTYILMSVETRSVMLTRLVYRKVDTNIIGYRRPSMGKQIFPPMRAAFLTEALRRHCRYISMTSLIAYTTRRAASYGIVC